MEAKSADKYIASVLEKSRKIWKWPTKPDAIFRSKIKWCLLYNYKNI